MRFSFPALLLCVLSLFVLNTRVGARAVMDTGVLVVKKTADFEPDGEGKSENWSKTAWVPMTVQESPGAALETNVKLLYSNTGIYFLFKCMDEKLVATMEEDFLPLYKEDVVEIFLWPDQLMPVYFEYEISPLNYEWPILVPNFNGRIGGWRPMNYEGGRKTKHATAAQGGPKVNNASIKSWTAEVFIPFALLGPMTPAKVEPGTKWRANMYRIDHDKGDTYWSWQKTTPKLRGSLHEYKKFGTLVFE